MNAISLAHLTSDGRRYWPMHITDGDSLTGFRVGGLPPVGVIPEGANEWTQYFGTFPIAGDGVEELSIFCSLNYDDTDNPSFLTKHIYQSLGSEIIQCVFHDPARRAKKSRFRSELEAYGVRVGKEAMDDSSDPNGGVPHKVGGLPFFQYEHPRVRKASADLLESGYVHLLQWSFPGTGDCDVKGDWPFANNSFHLYLKVDGQDRDCRALLV